MFISYIKIYCIFVNIMPVGIQLSRTRLTMLVVQGSFLAMASTGYQWNMTETYCECCARRAAVAYQRPT